ncbi:MAG: hypothetical protein IBJ03_15100 [Gemmatimonadaceae bacterium]|nr:hypothetical protein [Gemmatimonadaceae bacterium]
MSSSPSGRRPSTLAADRFRAASRPLGAPVDLKPRVPHEIPKEIVPVMAAPRKTWKEMHAENSRTGNGRPGATQGTVRLNDPWASVTGPKAGKPDVAPRVVASGIDLPQSAPAKSQAKPAAKSAGKSAAKSSARGKTKGAAKTGNASTRSRSESLLVSSLLATFALVTVAVASVTVTGNMQEERSRTAIAGTLAQVHQQQTSFRVLNQRFASWPELQAMGMKVPEGQRVVRSNATMSHWFVALRDDETGVTCSRTGELFDDSATDRSPTCSKLVP